VQYDLVIRNGDVVDGSGTCAIAPMSATTGPYRHHRPDS
jgi:N-acyl-D-aspartate/D-glutamate deacylase